MGVGLEEEWHIIDGRQSIMISVYVSPHGIGLVPDLIQQYVQLVINLNAVLEIGSKFGNVMRVRINLDHGGPMEGQHIAEAQRHADYDYVYEVED